jgi:hypothetical protein
MTNSVSDKSHRVTFSDRLVGRGSPLRSMASFMALTVLLLLSTEPLHCQNDALRIDGKGNVGIGTPTPSAPLQVNGDAKVDKDLTVGSELKAKTADIDGNLKAKTASINGNLSSSGAIRLTQTTGGELQLQYIKSTEGNNAIHRIGFADGVGNWMSWTQFGTNGSYIAGNLGIGTSPAEKARLSVNGDIKLGGNADDYASASLENLRMLRGTVHANGAILAGKGFTVAHPKTGVYQIKFQQGSFSGLPSATANQLALQTDSLITDNALIDSVTTVGMTVYVGAAGKDNNRLDRSFSFIVMGPR